MRFFRMSQPRRAARPAIRRHAPSFALAGSLSPALAALDGLVERHGAGSALAPRLTPRESALSLDRTARLLCAEAREADPDRAERMVIALRCVWRDLPAVRRLPADEHRARLFDTIVSACIARFYAPAADAHAESAASAQPFTERRAATG